MAVAAASAAAATAAAAANVAATAAAAPCSYHHCQLLLVDTTTIVDIFLSFLLMKKWQKIAAVSTLILIAIFYRVMTCQLRFSLCCNFRLFRLKILTHVAFALFIIFIITT